MSRYNNRLKAINRNEQYDKIFKKRGIVKLVQYRTPSAKYVSQEKISSIEATEYMWGYGDSFWKLAAQYYGDHKLWWVIASFNRKPTDSHVKLGDIIYIPLSLADALQVVE